MHVLKNHQKGFSLVEILVAVSIIGILSVVGLGAAASIQKSTRDAQRESDLRTLQSALQQYYADNQHYPGSMDLSSPSLIELNNCTGKSSCNVVTKKYLTTIPRDPATGTLTPYCYQSQTTSLNPATCNSQNAGSCHFYVLCALSELGGSSSRSCTCNNKNYNLKITPL